MLRLSSLAITLICLILPAVSYAQDYVVLLHGIFRSSKHMQPIEEVLTKEGYEVINLDYPSTHYPLEELITRTAHEIDIRTPDKTRKVHFVAYSMGGLLARGIITHHRPQQLGRVVLLGVPNHGSEVADFWKGNILYKTVYGPAGQQLDTQNKATEALCGKVDYELGVIAGKSTIDPFSSYLIPGEDDGKVSVASTRIDGMKDHITLPVTHTFFPSNEEVLQAIVRFLRDGEFSGR